MGVSLFKINTPSYKKVIINKFYKINNSILQSELLTYSVFTKKRREKGKRIE